MVTLRDRDRTPTGEVDVDRGGTDSGRTITQLAGAVGTPTLYSHIVE